MDDADQPKELKRKLKPVIYLFIMKRTKQKAGKAAKDTWRRAGQGVKHNATLQPNEENELKWAGADEVRGDRWD